MCVYVCSMCMCKCIQYLYVCIYIYAYVYVGGGIGGGNPPYHMGRRGGGGAVNTRHRTIYIYILLGDGNSLKLSFYQVGHLPTKYHCRICH